METTGTLSRAEGSGVSDAGELRKHGRAQKVLSMNDKDVKVLSCCPSRASPAAPQENKSVHPASAAFLGQLRYPDLAALSR